MGILSGWVISIVGIVVAGVLVDVVVVEGQTAKYIKTILSVMTVFIIALPLPKLIKSDYNVADIFGEDSAVVIDEDYLNFINELQIEEAEKQVVDVLEQMGHEVLKVTVDCDFEQKKMLIKAVKIVINIDKPHINITQEIEKAVCEQLNIEGELVRVYGREEGE